MADTYTATLAADDGSTTEVELEFVNGNPVKSFTREASEGTDGDGAASEVWELDSSAADYTYRSGGRPEHDYS